MAAQPPQQQKEGKHQMKQQSPAKWVAATAMGLALVVAAQYLGTLIPSIAVIFGPFSVKQLITGTLVNCVLLVFTAQVGLASGAVIGVLSAFLAAFLGISQIAVSPAVAVGNALLCVVYGLLTTRTHIPFAKIHIPAMLAGAVVKCGFLWLVVPLVLNGAGLPEKQAAMLSIMFSWPQGVTALCGGLLSWPIISRLSHSRR